MNAIHDEVFKGLSSFLADEVREIVLSAEQVHAWPNTQIEIIICLITFRISVGSLHLVGWLENLYFFILILFKQTLVLRM